MNREWTGIDRLRLDKFYMVRGCAPLLGPGEPAGPGELGHSPECCGLWASPAVAGWPSWGLTLTSHGLRGERRPWRARRAWVARHVPHL